MENATEPVPISDGRLTMYDRDELFVHSYAFHQEGVQIAFHSWYIFVPVIPLVPEGNLFLDAHAGYLLYRALSRDCVFFILTSREHYTKDDFDKMLALLCSSESNGYLIN